MKRFTNFITRVRKLFNREYALYTCLFFAMMAAMYIYMIFGIGTDAPGFLYAEF